MMWTCDLCKELFDPSHMYRVVLEPTRPKGSVILCEACKDKMLEASPQIEEYIFDAR